MVTEFGRIDFIFLAPPLPGRWIRYWKLRLVAVRKLLLIFVFGTSGCKKLSGNPKSNSTSN